MNLLGTPTDKDAVAAGIVAEIARVNNANLAQDKPEWVNVQVGYRLTGHDVTLREEPWQQVAPEVPEILSRLVRHIRLAYGQMSVEVVTGNNRRRFVTFDLADILFVEITTEPHVPEQNQDDQRRTKLRGGGRVAPLPVPPDRYDQLPETD